MRQLLSRTGPAWRLQRLVLIAMATGLLAAACSSGAASTPTPTPLPPALAPTPTPQATASAPDASPEANPITPSSQTPPPSPAPTVTIPADLLQRLQEIEQRVIGIRGLVPVEDPVRRFVSREELQRRLREEAENEAEEIAVTQRILTLLGLLEPDQDLLELQVSQLTNQVLGFFESHTGELFIVGESGDFSLLDEFTYAHEYVHALQHARFDLSALHEAREDDSEAGAALRAVVEGGATLVQTQYAQEHMNIRRLLSEIDDLGVTGEDDRFPFVLQESLVFPYENGREFVRYLLDDGGWPAVDAAYESLPVTTEQILHPEKYLAGEAALDVSMPDIAAALGDGWTELDADVMGELTIRILLDAFLSRRDADRASAGWGGDRLLFLEGPAGQELLVILARWDSEKDAEQFFDAYVKLLERRDADVDERSASVQATTGNERHVLRIEGDQTLWIVTTDPAVVDLVVGLFPDF
ncbi:MAG: hypothetical protein IIB12_02280 [Chloroflexi bacterium]|nr:hypothetical protein [Chloroflexota bacterium]